MPAFVDKTGQRFGRLLVKSVASMSPRVSWNCICDCGKTVVVKSSSLGRQTNSCGCIRRENTSMLKFSHGDTGSPEHRAWGNMKARCYITSSDFYERYGGRGITVCDRWKNSFANFLADVGRRPSPHHSLDRIKVDGNYEPGNVRWATPDVQANNTSVVSYFEWNGITKTCAEWAKDLGVSRAALKSRLQRGWSIEDAMTSPVIDGKRFRRKGK